MEEVMAAVNSEVFGVWFLIGAALVFWMQAGFAMVETGFTRAKNAGNILMKNLMDFCIGTVVFVLLGFGLFLGEDTLFGLLGKLGDKDAINAAADSLGCHIYLLYRLLHRAAGGSTAYFALPEEDCAAGAASAGASLARTDYARALAKLSREKAAFPDMSHETLNSAFPGRSQGMIQVLSTADGQLNRLNQSGLK